MRAVTIWGNAPGRTALNLQKLESIMSDQNFTTHELA